MWTAICSLRFQDTRRLTSFRWDGIDLPNGRLLAAAEEQGFEVFLTVDKNIRFQQSFAKRSISLVVLDSPRIDSRSLMPFVEAVLRRLATPLEPGSVVVITPDDLVEQP